MNRKNIISNIMWKFLQIGGRKAIQFVIQILLARLLLPADYGIVSLVVIFITLANVFVDSGLSTSVIQKKDVDQLDYSSIFYVNIVIALSLYIILFITAPWIASFYENESLINIIRILSLSLFPGALNSLQIAIISREMQFRRLFFSNIVAGLVSGIVGVSLAVRDYGAYALVFQQLVNQSMITLILWFTIKWRPLFVFSFNRIQVLFSYGWKILVSSVINVLYRDIRTLVIGKLFSPTILGYYNRGVQFPQVIVENIAGAIDGVMFPALSAIQDSVNSVKSMTRRTIITSSFLLFPILAGLIVIANPLVLLLLTDKWLPSVPYLRLFCIAFAFWPLQTANIQAIKAIGRSDIFLRNELFKIVIGIIVLVISLPFGVLYIALGQVVVEFISLLLNIYPVRNLISYGYTEQLKNIFPIAVLSLFMGLFIWQFANLAIPPIILIGIQVILGATFYFGFAFVLKLECFTYLIDAFKTLLGRRS